jgi:hypothetical protein
MKKDKIIYWTATGIVATVMLWSAINFSFNAEMKGAFAHLGLPGWFRVELSAAKILGVCALVLPIIPNRIKEFAYFGFALTIISAPIAHISSGDGILRGLEPLIFLGFLIVSYLYYHKAEGTDKNHPGRLEVYGATAQRGRGGVETGRDKPL